VTRSALALALVVPLVAGCGSASESAPSGLDEPLRLRFTPPRSSSGPIAGQFFAGPLPAGEQGPVISISNTQAFVFPGEQGKKMAGTAGVGSTGVALKFKDIGSGFWVAPVLIPDTTVGGNIWDVQLDFGIAMPLGSQLLQVTAVDGDGRWGPPSQTPLVFQAIQATGAAVATLAWDSNADLDLQILTPTGQIDAKHRTGAGFVDGGLPAGQGVLDRDSNANCVPDGTRQEDVIWSSAPTPGLYLAKVDMFSTCGEPVANFVFKLYVQDQLTLSIPGRLIAQDADNGVGPGLAITNFQF